MRRLAILLVLLAAAPAAADAEPRIDAVRFGGDGARTRVVIESDQPLAYRHFTLAEQGDRLVIDLPRSVFALAGAAIGRGQKSAPGMGLVERYRFAHTSARRSRIVFDLAAPARVVQEQSLSPSRRAPRHRLVLDLDRVSRDAFAAHAGFPASVAPAGAPPRPEDRGAFIVVVDPGHGGRDPGAIGQAGAHEKDINLAAAKALEKELTARGHEVALTRSDDSHVELGDRVAFARAAGANLFISLHADSAPAGSTARGASVYTLSENAETRVEEVLEGNNWVFGADLTGQPDDVREILVSLARRETKSQSDIFADRLIKRLGDVGPLLANSHRNKGLKVLLAPDVPAVLVELGFLSHPGDEAVLSSPARLQARARAIADAVDDYLKERERLYAAR